MKCDNFQNWTKRYIIQWDQGNNTSEQGVTCASQMV